MPIAGSELSRAATFDHLQLSGDGMEFASEMVIKATLKGCEIAEVPATLSRDLRDRPPHLRPWRDGWRHLRYLLMLSPTWLFAVPSAVFAAIALAIFTLAGLGALEGGSRFSYIGNYWSILAGGLLTVAHSAALLAAAGNLYGIREGYRRRSDWSKTFARWASLETMLIAGAVCVLVGGGILAALFSYWSAHRFEPHSERLACGARNLAHGHRRAKHSGRLPDGDRQRQRRGVYSTRALPLAGSGSGERLPEPDHE